MEIMTNLERVSEYNGKCPGCGSVLGLKMILQSIGDLKNTVVIMPPEDMANLGVGLRVNVVSSGDPAAAARGLSVSRPDLKIIVYSSDSSTRSKLPSILAAEENFLYVCSNTACYPDGRLQAADFVRSIFSKTSYAATANVAYYEDFVAKLRKAFSKTGFKFIDLLCPCPALWGFDTSNTVEVGRMATESLLWPLYEVDGRVTITKMPPRTEPVSRYFELLKAHAPENDIQVLQERTSRAWRALNDGKLA